MLNMNIKHRRMKALWASFHGTRADHLPVSRLATLFGSNRDLLLSPCGELGAVSPAKSEGPSPAGAEVLSSASTPPGGKSDAVGSYCE